MKKRPNKSTVDSDELETGETREGEDTDNSIDDGSKSIDDQLGELFDTTWGDTEARTFDEVPDGLYQTRVLAANLNNAKSSGRFQCSWEVLILEGDYRGRHLFKHDGLDTEDGVSYFKGSLARLGYEEPASKEELQATLKEIVDAPTYVTARVSTRKRKVEGVMEERKNVRFVKALDSNEVTDDFDESELTSYLDSSNANTELGDPDESSSKNNTKPKQHKVPAKKNEPVEEESACKLKKGVKLEGGDRKVIKTLANQLDFNIDDYDSLERLLCELGDYCSLSGVFAEPHKLVMKIQKAIRAMQ